MTPSLNPDLTLSGHILVVDDEPSILAIAAAILNTIEVTPLKAHSGEVALTTAQAHYASGLKISLVIQDLTMPGGMSGFETMEALHDIDPNIHVIACSGFFQPGALELCQSIGFSNILTKPYTPESLLGLIRRTLLEASPKRSSKSAQTRGPSLATPACFTPTASPSTSKPSPFFDFTTHHLNLDEEDEDSTTFLPPPPQFHPAPTGLTHDHPSAQPECSHPATPTPLDELPEPHPSAPLKSTRPRRPSFLASALARSVRSQLQTHRDPAGSASSDDSSDQPLE
jgi:CheY-like chemotaxis protein